MAPMHSTVATLRGGPRIREAPFCDRDTMKPDKESWQHRTCSYSRRLYGEIRASSTLIGTVRQVSYIHRSIPFSIPY